MPPSQRGKLRKIGNIGTILEAIGNYSSYWSGPEHGFRPFARHSRQQSVHCFGLFGALSQITSVLFPSYFPWNACSTTARGSPYGIHTIHSLFSFSSSFLVHCSHLSYFPLVLFPFWVSGRRSSAPPVGMPICFHPGWSFRFRLQFRPIFYFAPHYKFSTPLNGRFAAQSFVNFKTFPPNLPCFSNFSNHGGGW